MRTIVSPRELHRKIRSIRVPQLLKCLKMSERQFERHSSGQSLATLPLTLDKPDVSGRFRQVAQLPTDALQAGDYALRRTVTHGTQREVREAKFSLTE
jgi:hypothetical protein